jgi:hypothetical protein
VGGLQTGGFVCSIIGTIWATLFTIWVIIMFVVLREMMLTEMMLTF